MCLTIRDQHDEISHDGSDRFTNDDDIRTPIEISVDFRPSLLREIQGCSKGNGQVQERNGLKEAEQP